MSIPSAFMHLQAHAVASGPSKIAIIVPDLRVGGAERVAVNLANGFLARGYAVDVVALSAFGPLLSALHNDVRVVDLGTVRLRWALLPLVRYFRSARPSAVLGSMWPLTALLVVARAVSRLSFRLVLSEHCTWSQSELLPRPFMKTLIRTSMRYAFPKADGIVSVSKGAADDLANFGAIRRSSVSVIYNPIVGARLNTTALAPAEPAGWCTASQCRILAVGSLKEIKDYPTLLRAFRKLRERVDAKLLILGDGQCRASLEAQCIELAIADSVFMPGSVLDPTPYFAHADLHVLSSTSEGLGNVIVEAMAVGTPVVSTDCEYGPREILAEGKFGPLVPVGDADALCAAMAASLNSVHDRESLMRRAQDFSIENAVDRYLELLSPASPVGGNAP